MPRLLILLTLPPDVTEQYRLRLSRAFPELEIDVVNSRDKLGTALAEADMLLTFGQMMKNLKLDLADAANLKWVQALGTGLDGITDQPALKPGVTVTSLHGVHGAPVSEAALAAHAGAVAATCRASCARRTSINGSAGRPSCCTTRPSASSASA